MRLTADTILRAEVYLNPLLDRELNLRGYKIPAIENVGAAQDQFDTIDLSDNEIRKVGNFPRMRRLKTLLLNNNYIAHIEATLGNQIPNLEFLILTNNRIANLSELRHLTGCSSLSMLSLLGNPVIYRQHYRLYLIHLLPQLKVIDFRKVTQGDRRESKALFISDAGATMLEDVEKEGVRVPRPADLNGGVSADSEEAAADMASKMESFSPEEKARLRDLIAAAKSPEDIDRIEKMIRSGRLPSAEEMAANGDAAGEDAMDTSGAPHGREIGNGASASGAPPAEPAAQPAPAIAEDLD